MPIATTLLLFALATLAQTASPGPGVLYVAARSLCQGRRAGLASMLGIESGDWSGWLQPGLAKAEDGQRVSRAARSAASLTTSRRSRGEPLDNYDQGNVRDAMSAGHPSFIAGAVIQGIVRPGSDQTHRRGNVT
jgi:hypothetical protein